MPVISLLTDFGLSDAYVGIMKGVILSMALKDGRVLPLNRCTVRCKQALYGFIV